MTWGKAWPGKLPTVAGLLRALRKVQKDCTPDWSFDVLRLMEATTWTYLECKRVIRLARKRGLVRYAPGRSRLTGTLISTTSWFRLTNLAMATTIPLRALDGEERLKRRTANRETQRIWMAKHREEFNSRRRSAHSSQNIHGSKAAT